MRALSKAGNTPFSLTMALDALAREKQSRGEDIINLTAGEVDLPASSLGAEAGERAFREGFTRYTASSGADFLKEAVRAAYYPAYAKEQILIGNGAKSCLNAAVACIAGPGERVLLPAPCYVSYPEMIRLAGAEAVLLQTRRSEGFKLRPAELRAAVTPNTAALLLNNPCNPTGAVYSFAELAESAVKEIFGFSATRYTTPLPTTASPL